MIFVRMTEGYLYKGEWVRLIKDSCIQEPHTGLPSPYLSMDRSDALEDGKMVCEIPNQN